MSRSMTIALSAFLFTHSVFAEASGAQQGVASMSGGCTACDYCFSTVITKSSYDSNGTFGGPEHQCQETIGCEGGACIQRLGHVSDAASGKLADGDLTGVLALMERHGALKLNAERQAPQMEGCSGEVAVHLPIDAMQLANLIRAGAHWVALSSIETTRPRAY